MSADLSALADASGHFAGVLVVKNEWGDRTAKAFSCTASDDDDSESSASSSDTDAEDEAKPTTITREELREDLAAVGLRGTADELRANVGYIRRAVEKKPPPKVKADALDFLECK